MLTRPRCCLAEDLSPEAEAICAICRGCIRHVVVTFTIAPEESC